MACYVGLVGLIVGSYLNVLIHRLPRGQSTVLPRSRCPRCRAAIAARDNVPLFSYLLLRGRCRACGARISWRYPAVEAGTAALFMGCYARFGATPSMVVGCVLCALLLALAVIDAQHFLLPDKLTYPGILIGLAGSYFASWTTPASSALATLCGALVLLGLIGLWYLVRRQLAMGFGDPKMMAMIGAFLGVRLAIFTLFLASLLGAAIGLVLLLAGRANWSSRLPFGIFLAAGAALALFFGEPLVEAYLGMF
ncbi:MAG TPA: prepilin peptidase [Thermoanaerobaculia bacterium]|nr:prepilin peptidase [Thermoanaerobaculia bacterium]